MTISVSRSAGFCFISRQALIERRSPLHSELQSQRFIHSFLPTTTRRSRLNILRRLIDFGLTLSPLAALEPRFGRGRERERDKDEYRELWFLSWQISVWSGVCNERSKTIDVCICLLMQRYTHSWTRSLSSVLSGGLFSSHWSFCQRNPSRDMYTRSRVDCGFDFPDGWERETEWVRFHRAKSMIGSIAWSVGFIGSTIHGSMKEKTASFTRWTSIDIYMLG